jgi:cell division protein FtsW
VNLRHLIPFFDTDATSWSMEARWLRWLIFLWLIIGLAVLFSASYAIADSQLDDGLYYVKLQLFWIGVGLVGFNLIVHSPLRYILSIADWCLLLLLSFILLTLIPGLGTTVNGATRWLVVGSFAIQPSELLKPFLVLQSARLFGRWDQIPWATRLSWLGIFGLVVVAILLQPNLSTAALCGMMLWFIALAAGIPYSYLGGTALIGFTLAVISVSFRSYQRKRIMSFLNPWADPQGDGYQLIQSILAVGSGGFWGTGFGLSQQKLFYLPIQYTDFIFAVFAEEFGFVGCMLLLLLLAAFSTLAVRVAMKAQNPVHRLIAVGVMVLIVGQSLLNIGVATGVLPTTGLPFPFLSYGGSSMIASLLSAGLLVRVAREGSEAEVVALKPRQPNDRTQRRSRRRVTGSMP